MLLTNLTISLIYKDPRGAALRAEETPDYVVQPVRGKVLGDSLAASVAIWISGQDPSNAEKDQTTPN